MNHENPAPSETAPPQTAPSETAPPDSDMRRAPALVTAPGRLRQVRPGTCPDCDAAVPADARFCPSCQSFLPVPYTGRLASAKRRLGASFLDSLIRDGGALGSVFWPMIMPPGLGKTVVGALSTVYWLGSMYLWTRGTTPAKRLLQMKVIDDSGEAPGFFRMAFRETIGKAISAMVFGMGLIAIPFHREKQGWHDTMVGTWVVIDEEP